MVDSWRLTALPRRSFSEGGVGSWQLTVDGWRLTVGDKALSFALYALRL